MICQWCKEEIETGEAYISFKDIIVHADCLDYLPEKEPICDSCYKICDKDDLIEFFDYMLCRKCIEEFTETKE